MLEKGVCDLFLHGTIESPTSSVHQAFNSALGESLTMQDTIYDMMADKGWYPTEQAEQKKRSTPSSKNSAVSDKQRRFPMNLRLAKKSRHSQTCGCLLFAAPVGAGKSH